MADGSRGRVETRVSTLVAALAMAGCAGPPTVMELRLNLPPEDAALAVAAADEWHQRTGVAFEPVVYTAEGCASHDCVYVDEVPQASLDAGWAMSDCSDNKGAGCTMVVLPMWQAHVRVASDLRAKAAGRGWDGRMERLVQHVFLHELGHAIGLDHDDDEPGASVMKASIADASEHTTDVDWWHYQQRHGAR